MRVMWIANVYDYHDDAWVFVYNFVSFPRLFRSVAQWDVEARSNKKAIIIIIHTNFVQTYRPEEKGKNEIKNLVSICKTGW